MKIVLLIPLMISATVNAAEVTGPPPVDLMLLPFKKVLEGEPIKGPHGKKSYCYEVEGIYTIYSRNLLGDGYSFSKEAPLKKCVASNLPINTTNNLGLTVGVSQETAGNLLGFILLEGENIIQWYYQRPIHNLPYDDLTTLEIKIKSGVVHAISVFNTVTH